MCRLLGFAATRETNLPTLAGSPFGDYVALAEVHKDSWGLALDTKEGDRCITGVESAAASSRFQSAIESNATAGLLHFRWASPGIQVIEENAHPFSQDGISFIHNGAITPYDALLESIPQELLALREGTGDSELFFLFALAKIRTLGFREGVLTTIRELRASYEYSSINSMFLNSESLIVISEHHPDDRPSWTTPDYYELRYRLDDRGLLVASSGWDQSGWQLLPNHAALIVDRSSMATELIEL